MSSGKTYRIRQQTISFSMACVPCKCSYWKEIFYSKKEAEKAIEDLDKQEDVIVEKLSNCYITYSEKACANGYRLTIVECDSYGNVKSDSYGNEVNNND